MMSLQGATVALVEHPRNLAAYRGLWALRAMGAQMVLVTSDPERYRPQPWWPASPLESFDFVVHAATSRPDSVVLALSGRFGHLDVVMSFSHYFCGVAARVSKQFGLGGSNPSAVEAAIDKVQLRRRLEGSPYSLGWRYVGSEDDVDDAVQSLGLPLVVKPPNGVSSTDVMLASSADEARYAVRLLLARGPLPVVNMAEQHGVLLEEYASGPEYSVEAMTTTRGTEVLGTTLKTPFDSLPFIEQADTFSPLALAPTREAVSAALGSIASLPGFLGPSHAEVRVTQSGPKLIELNPRQGGGHIPTLIEMATGRNVFVETVAERLGVVVPRSSETLAHATWWQVYSHRDGLLHQLKLGEAGAASARLWQPLARKGDPVRLPRDNKDCIASIITTGSTSEASLLAARRISRYVLLEVD